MSKEEILKFLLFLTVILVVVILFWHEFASTPVYRMSPGDPVVVLTGQTVIYHGTPCQIGNPGFISPTDPENKLRWSRAERFFFPLHAEVAVIYSDSHTVEWAKTANIVKLPADPSELICPFSAE